MLSPVSFSKSFWQGTHLYAYGCADSRSGSILSPQFVQILPGNIGLTVAILASADSLEGFGDLPKFIGSLNETIPVRSNL